ncbi:PAS domain S-box protein [Flavisolibacter tropicus]|uniref:histidine kinase n=1 Tax=Flavisolibacter tropicus TaxID=1492898 RepID=A0A172U0Z1_9BACT|nr:PAS domain S-box protein [Flavisolibacter tropicus]ANE52667.1 hypothetical protein SY85_21470 [Flavisolibacter tropicus]
MISAHHTELIINSFPGIFYIVDPAGKFLQWNNNLETISGYSADDIKGMILFDLFRNDEKQLMAETMHKAVAEGFADMDGYLISKQGQPLPHYFTGTLTVIDNRPYLIGTGIDISRRRRAEKNLKESEERYRLIVETAQEGIWMIDENSLTTFVNEPMAQMLGYSREEMAGKHLYDFMKESEFMKADSNIARRRKGIADEEEFVFQKKDGQLIWAHLHVTPIFKEEEYKGALAMVTDITDKREAEQQLRLSEQRFKSLVQNSSDLISINDEQGVCRYVSPTVSEILGYTPEDLQGRNALDLVHPDDKPVLFIKMQQFLKGRKLISSPYRYLNANNEWRWLESRGVNLLNDPDIKGLVITSRDITERIELQTQLDQRSKEIQKEMTAAVIKAQENERSQLGQELHDNVNQVLTTVKLYNEMLRDGIGRPDDLLSKSIYHLQICINEIRSISKRLSAPTLGHISLQDSIKELVESINLIRRVNIIYTIDGHVNSIASQELHLAIYRIVQEQLNNILKYAEANYATIEISFKDHTLSLMIRDDGKGFDMSQKKEGIGITNMKSRAENLNGNFHINSAPGQGCMIKVSIPIAAAN